MPEKNNVQACVIGYPIHHSRSPLMHNHWIDQYKLDGHYGIESVSSDGLNSFIESVKDGDSVYIGGNATIPHKEMLLKTADHADSTAKAVGAANTFWVKHGQLYVMNTDVFGFLANLDEKAPGWDESVPGQDKVACMLGAGGAAKAVLFALMERNFTSIIIANRTASRAISLVDQFADQAAQKAVNLSAIAMEKMESHLPDVDLLVNTTSLGMEGQPDLALDLGDLPQRAVVTDIVYAPLITPLLSAAEARGNRIVDGLGMLLHQAVPGFEKWFGIRPTVTSELRHLVEVDLTA